MTVDGMAHEIKAGDSIFVARGAVHQFQNLHAGDARVLSMLTPGSIGTAYFEELADVVNAGGPPNLAKVKDIMLRHGLVPAQPAEPQKRNADEAGDGKSVSLPIEGTQKISELIFI